MEQEVGPDTDSLLVEQLDLNSFYVFRVRAQTTAGAGSYSDGVTESTGAHETHTECSVPVTLQHTAASALPVTRPHCT